MAHRCPVKGCTVKNVDDEMLMCGPHWRMVPGPLQTNVWRAYRRTKALSPGAPIQVPNRTDALCHAQDAAIQAVNDKLARSQ